MLRASANYRLCNKVIQQDYDLLNTEQQRELEAIGFERKQRAYISPQWKEMYHRLAVHLKHEQLQQQRLRGEEEVMQDDNGGTAVESVEETKRLRAFIHRMRRLRMAGDLSRRKIELLDAIGFTWITLPSYDATLLPVREENSHWDDILID